MSDQRYWFVQLSYGTSGTEYSTGDVHKIPPEQVLQDNLMAQATLRHEEMKRTGLGSSLRSPVYNYRIKYAREITKAEYDTFAKREAEIEAVWIKISEMRGA